MYAENCHCSRGGNITTTTDDDDEIQQYFVVDHQQQHQQQHCYPVGQQTTLSRRPSVSSCTSRVSHRSTPRSRRVTTPMSCCSHHSHHSQPAPSSAGAHQHHQQPLQHRRSQDGGSPANVSRRTLPTDSGSNATISNFNINPARFQCSYYTADESENSYCSISGENIRQIQAQTAIQHRLDREEQKQRLLPLPLQPTGGSGGGAGAGVSPGTSQPDNDSQQDVASLDETSLLSTVGSTSSAEQGGQRGGGGGNGGGSTTTTTSTTTSTTQRQLQQQVGGETPKSAGSQLVLTPSKITIENIGQLSEIGTEHYEFDDLDINIPEIFQSPSKIKWSFLANLDESNKSNKSRISSVSSLVDAASSGRGRFSGTESGGADVSETASDNEYNSPNRRIRRRRPEPLPSEAMMAVAGTSGSGAGGHQSTTPGGGHGIQASSSSCKIEELLKKSSPSASSDFKTVSIWRAENGDEGNAIIFHHESEIVENCCTNHFLDHSSYDVCRVDNCDYLIKSSDTDTPAHGPSGGGGADGDEESTVRGQRARRRRSSSCTSLCKSTERLNNAIVPPATIAGTMTKQLELKQRNIFTTTLASTTPSGATMTHAPSTGSPLVMVPSGTPIGAQTSSGGVTGVTAATATAATVYSIISPDLKRFEKQTNLNRNSVNLSQNLPSSPSSSSTSSIFAGNYAGSSVYRNINHNHHHHHHHHSEQQHQQQQSERDKLSNTMSRASSSRSRLNTAPASTVSRSATSSLQRHSVGSRGLSLPSASGGGGTSMDGGFNNNQQPSGSNNNNNNNQSYYSSTFDRSTAPRTLSTASLGLGGAPSDGRQEPGGSDPSAPPFSISVTDDATAETVAAASQFYNKSYHYNLTAQNQLYFQAFSNLVREQEQQQQQQNCEFHQQQPQTPSPQPQPSCPQCYEYYGCQAQYYANATNEADNEFAECHAGGETGAGGVMRRRDGWRRNVGTTLRINGLVRVVRTRARKCADYIRQKEHQSNNRFRRRK